MKKKCTCWVIYPCWIYAVEALNALILEFVLFPPRSTLLPPKVECNFMILNPRGILLILYKKHLPLPEELLA